MCTLECISEKLGGLAFEEAIKAWKYVRHYTENLQRLQFKLRDLGDCTATITRVVSEAIGRGDEIKVSVSHWQTDADSLKVDIEQLIRESNTKASISCIACSCPNIMWRYKFSKQAEEKMADVDALIVKYNDFNHQISHPRSHYMENLQKLKDKLRDLDDCRETITREVSEANGHGDEIEVNVSHWQTDAGSLKDDIEQLIRESANICSTECTCPDITWQYNFSKQAEEKIADADGLIIKYTNFNHQISHPRSHYAENLQKLKDKLRDLDDCRETITRKVSEANGRGDEIEVNVSHWQTDTGSLKDDLEQLIRESTTKANICSTSECPFPDIMWQYNFSKQAEDKIADADGLIIKYNNFNQISYPRPRPPELESLSDKNYVNFDSRASIFMDIMDALKDSNVNMIGVFGLGGAGKTTFVKEVGEQMRKDGTFKQVAMAVVSKDLNVEEVQSKLADSLNFEFKAKANDQKRRATELWNKFTNGDKYLIILDDIWEKVDLKAIGIPITDGKTGCKVVLTSRNKDLLSSRMEVNRNFSIRKLMSAEAWTLFTKKVGNTFESQPELYSLAYKVCTKCKGLPIAVNALGEALKGKQEHAWTTALDKLEKYMLTKIEGIDPSVLASLRVSYDMLPSADAKSCFLLCCLFAEDAEIPVDELMRLCVARNLLHQNPCTLDKARDAVRTVVDTLKSASLLTIRGHGTVVKIHDVIRDVGISIAREEEAFLVDHGAHRWPRNPTNGLSYKAMSLSFKNIKKLPDGLVYQQLETLMVDNSELSDIDVPDNFFNGMMQLTVLTFTRMHMQRLPSSLAKLTNLRMLYLNRCELEDIAILKDLKSNLEVLSLRGSGIEVLPSEIRQLTNLRVLDLQDCDKLKVIPRGVISNLTGLEELYFPMTFDKWEATTDEQQDISSRDNASLEELRELLANAQLTTLHIHVPNVKLLPKEDLKFADLKGFRISVGSKFEYREAFISRTCMLKLEGIQLRNEFIPLVDKAAVLVLKSESSVHPLQLFNKLTVLIIEHFKLKYLFSPTTARGLVHLEKLEVTSCEIMEGIVGFEEQEDENEITGEVKFSKLKRLELRSLPNLISFFAKKEKMGTTIGSFSARAQPLFNELVAFPVLQSLSLEKLDKIIRIWDNQLLSEREKEAKSFCELTRIFVECCNQLEYVLPFYMLPQLKNVQLLSIRNCTKVEVIISNNPKEKEATNNNDTIRFPQLKTLELKDLPNLKSFICSETQLFFSNKVQIKVAFPVLERLHFINLDKITRIWDNQPLSEPKKEVKSFCELMVIKVDGCNQLEYVLPFYMLPLLKNLRELMIRDCRKMEVIIISTNPKEKEATNNNDTIRFPQLKTLELWGLPNLKSFICSETQLFFSNKDAFPVLEEIDLDEDSEILRDGTYTKEVSMENNKMADTSAAQARKGKDIQKIPWGRCNIGRRNITRDEYRQTRLEQYKNYENIPQSGERSEKDCKVTMKGGMYYEFRHNSRSVKSTILYRQLRNLVWATSKHDVYFMSHFSVTHWSALTWNKTEVLNVSGHVAPCEEHLGSLLEGLTETKFSTLAVKDRLLVAGGLKGELICKNLDRPGVCFCTKTTYDDNAVTNAVEIYSTQSGAVHFTVANNDCGVRDFDMEQFQLSKHFSFPWPVNHTSMSPDGKLRIIVGDNPEGMLVDSGTGKTVASLVGHSEFSLASAWHPDGLTFATGNRDKTCRIWDARNLSKSVAALKGNFGAIQSIRYSSDGRFMAMAEPADFVHVFDAKSGYEKEQEIDFFGEISGMSFSPDTESLFIGVCDDFRVRAAIGLWDRTYGGLLEFGRRRNN